jgi:hypothetical protein
MYRYAIFAAAATLSAVTTVYATPPVAHSEAKAGDTSGQVVCRGYARTGSLVDSVRICKTNREWQRDRVEQPPEQADSCRNRGTTGDC